MTNAGALSEAFLFSRIWHYYWLNIIKPNLLVTAHHGLSVPLGDARLYL